MPAYDIRYIEMAKEKSLSLREHKIQAETDTESI